MVVTIALAIGFRKSDNLAGAYGIAVSATMLMTSALLLIAMREIWQWSLLASLGVAGTFFYHRRCILCLEHLENP
jgi:KUP system potassium uptake protein